MGTFFNDMTPPVLFGVDARLETGKRAKALGCTKVLLFADEALFPLNFVDELQKNIEAEGIEVIPVEVKMGEPDAQRCDAYYANLKDEGHDGVVALGGGSTMDIAKVVCKLFANGGKTDDYMGYGNPAGNANYSPLIELPTTSGTGSEVNTGAMCNSTAGNKGAVAQLATLAVNDPVYTYGVPASVTANTGIDTLGHLTECLFNTENVEQRFSDMMAMRGIQLCFEWLPKVYKDGSDKEARYWMAFASLLGGYCMRTRKLTYGHTMANCFSDKYHWPHGIGASLGLAAVVRYGVKNIKDFREMLQLALNIPGDADIASKEIIKRYDELQRAIGMQNMKERGVEESFIDEMTEKIKVDSKWKIMTPPDFDKMKQSMVDSYNY